MRDKKLDDLISQLENHIECWKQFNQYINLARSKKFTTDDETQFLELKSVLAQELEIILSNIESGGPNKQDMIELLTNAPSVRYLSELQEGSLRTLENQWHRVFLSTQSILGLMKSEQKKKAGESFWTNLFSKKK